MIGIYVRPLAQQMRVVTSCRDLESGATGATRGQLEPPKSAKCWCSRTHRNGRDSEETEAGQDCRRLLLIRRSPVRVQPGPFRPLRPCGFGLTMRCGACDMCEKRGAVPPTCPPRICRAGALPESHLRGRMSGPEHPADVALGQAWRPRLQAAGKQQAGGGRGAPRHLARQRGGFVRSSLVTRTFFHASLSESVQG